MTCERRQRKCTVIANKMSYDSVKPGWHFITHQQQLRGDNMLQYQLCHLCCSFNVQKVIDCSCNFSWSNLPRRLLCSSCLCVIFTAADMGDCWSCSYWSKLDGSDTLAATVSLVHFTLAAVSGRMHRHISSALLVNAASIQTHTHARTAIYCNVTVNWKTAF